MTFLRKQERLSASATNNFSESDQRPLCLEINGRRTRKRERQAALRLHGVSPRARNPLELRGQRSRRPLTCAPEQDRYVRVVLQVSRVNYTSPRLSRDASRLSSIMPTSFGHGNWKSPGTSLTSSNPTPPLLTTSTPIQPPRSSYLFHFFVSSYFLII